MKIRHGFVSNSSSSSFVAIGKYIEYLDFTEEKMRQLLHEFNINGFGSSSDPADIIALFQNCLFNGDFGFDCVSLEGSYAFGNVLTRFSADGTIDEKQIDLEKLVKDTEVIKKNMQKVFGEDIELKLIFGTYPS